MALHDSHLANTQIDINNSVIDMYNGIIRNFCKHMLMLVMKYEHSVPSVI